MCLKPWNSNALHPVAIFSGVKDGKYINKVIGGVVFDLATTISIRLLAGGSNSAQLMLIRSLLQQTASHDT